MSNDFFGKDVPRSAGDILDDLALPDKSRGRK